MTDMARDPFDEARTHSKARSGRFARLAGALLSVLLVAAVGAWTYRIGQQDAQDVPVIMALEGPAKLQPEDPKGLRVEHQGLTVTAIVEGTPPVPRPGQVETAPPPAELAAEDLPRAALPIPTARPDTASADTRLAKPNPVDPDPLNPGVAEPDVAAAQDPTRTGAPGPDATPMPEAAERARPDPGETVSMAQLPPALRQTLTAPQMQDRADSAIAPDAAQDNAPQSAPDTPAQLAPDREAAEPGPVVLPDAEALPALRPERQNPERRTASTDISDRADATQPVVDARPAESDSQAAEADPAADALRATSDAPQIAPRPKVRPKLRPAELESELESGLESELESERAAPDPTILTTATPDAVPAAAAPENTPVSPDLAAASPARTSRAVDAAKAAFPPTGTQLIQLGAFDSPDIAQAEWQRLVQAHADLLGTKGPLVQRTVLSGRVFFRLRAEGFATLAEARNTCSALNARGLPCITRVQE
ncbi:MAG: SPOR domain-containing protein [Pseudomonadota bacterium]